MPTIAELHKKLDEIDAKIAGARQQMDFKTSLNDGHNLTSGELAARREYLRKRLEDEGVSVDAVDHHVSALEQDMYNWINSIDLAMNH